MTATLCRFPRRQHTNVRTIAISRSCLTGWRTDPTLRPLCLLCVSLTRHESIDQTSAAVFALAPEDALRQTTLTKRATPRTNSRQRAHMRLPNMSGSPRIAKWHQSLKTRAAAISLPHIKHNGHHRHEGKTGDRLDVSNRYRRTNYTSRRGGGG